MLYDHSVVFGGKAYHGPEKPAHADRRTPRPKSSPTPGSAWNHCANAMLRLRGRRSEWQARELSKHREVHSIECQHRRNVRALKTRVNRVDHARPSSISSYQSVREPKGFNIRPKFSGGRSRGLSPCPLVFVKRAFRTNRSSRANSSADNCGTAASNSASVLMPIKLTSSPLLRKRAL